MAVFSKVPTNVVLRSIAIGVFAYSRDKNNCQNMSAPGGKFRGRTSLEKNFLFFSKLINFFLSCQFFIDSIPNFRLDLLWKSVISSFFRLICEKILKKRFSICRMGFLDAGVLRQWLRVWLAPKAMSVKTRLVSSLNSISIPHHNIFKSRKCQF